MKRCLDKAGRALAKERMQAERRDKHDIPVHAHAHPTRPITAPCSSPAPAAAHLQLALCQARMRLQLLRQLRAQEG